MADATTNPAVLEEEALAALSAALHGDSNDNALHDDEYFVDSDDDNMDAPDYHPPDPYAPPKQHLRLHPLQTNVVKGKDN
jgi:hypothetical protein